MALQKWKLLSKKDVSPHDWFPIEMRSYQLPNGTIVEDFSVTTLADVAMIVAQTKDEKVVLVKQYKPGTDEIMIQFPAGRIEPSHADMQETAMHELEEETGIKADKSAFHNFGKISGFSTKATEKVYLYFVDKVEFNSEQNLDLNEEIEVLLLTPDEIESLIHSGQIWCGQTISAWTLAKKRFGALLGVTLDQQ